MVSVWTFSANVKREESNEKIPQLLKKILHDSFYDDKTFAAALASEPMRGASDYGKPYLLFLSRSTAVLVIRENDKRVTIYFVRSRSSEPLKELNSWLIQKFGIYAISGRVSPVPARIRKHLLELIIGTITPSVAKPEKPIQPEPPVEKAEAAAPIKPEKPIQPEPPQDEDKPPTVEL